MRRQFPQEDKCDHYTEEDREAERRDAQQKEFNAAHPTRPSIPERTRNVSEALVMDRLKAIRLMCGYVEDGSCEVVSIGQDDATSEWIVRVGKRHYSGTSFENALDEAIAKEKPRGAGR